ncbi:PH domain-containing protein [Streptomyces hirsutus]
MTAPQAPEAVRERRPVIERRLHPVTPLRRAWAPVAVVIGWALHDPDQAQRQLTRLTTTTLLIGLGVLIPAAALYGFLTWWFTHFAVTDSELRIRTGLLFRRTAHIRLERIQAVDVTQPLLARVAGVSKLKLDVIGTDKKDELAFLGADDARALRAELLARAAGFAPETAHEVGEAPSRQLLRVPPGVLALSLALTAATWVWLIVAAVALPLLWMTTHSLWTLLAAAVPVAGAVGASSVGRFVTEYDWTLGESPDGLRIDHGLLDRAHETVPPGRVQTVRIVEPLLWRRRAGCGWSSMWRARPTPCCCRSLRARSPNPSSRGCCPASACRRTRSCPGRRGARGGACRCGGAATDSPSPTPCSPLGTAG